ncbi:polysaccharide export protein, partial [Ruegeria sp. NA]|nr:polysaccharide export protein [Ruegeria sp. NA]
MKVSPRRWMRGVSLVAAIGLLAACQLPKSGPNKSEILAGSVQNGGNAYVVEVDDNVTRATSA